MSTYKIYIGLLSILSLVIVLSGCVNKNDSNVDKVGNITIGEPVTNSSNGTITVSGSITEPVSGHITESEINRENISTNIGTDWCVPGNKITIDKGEFTVIGITNYVDTNKNKVYENVCKAERNTKDENSFIYFNKGYINKENDQFFAMKSLGKNVSASSSVSVISKK